MVIKIPKDFVVYAERHKDIFAVGWGIAYVKVINNKDHKRFHGLCGETYLQFGEWGLWHDEKASRP